MAKNQEKIGEALKRIEAVLQNIQSDKDWIQFLTFQSRFYRYSAKNTLLIFSQNLEATYVKGYRAWNDLGRFVKKGAKGIAVLAPCFKKVEDEELIQHTDGEKAMKKVLYGFTIKYVYDIADTDGSNEHIPVLVKGLEGDTEEEEILYERLRNIISKEFMIQEVSGTASKGSYNLMTNIISVRSDLDTLHRIKTLLHEYSHAVDFEINPDETISIGQRELIAESSAYVISSRLGLDTTRYTSGYLNTWIREKDDLASVSDAVQKVACIIIERLAESSEFAFLS